MFKEQSHSTLKVEKPLRGWDALEQRLKARGLSVPEIEEARRSFFAAIDNLTVMFFKLSSAENETGKKTVV